MARVLFIYFFNAVLLLYVSFRSLLSMIRNIRMLLGLIMWDFRLWMYEKEEFNTVSHNYHIIILLPSFFPLHSPTYTNEWNILWGSIHTHTHTYIHTCITPAIKAVIFSTTYISVFNLTCYWWRSSNITSTLKTIKIINKGWRKKNIITTPLKVHPFSSSSS